MQQCSRRQQNVLFANLALGFLCSVEKWQVIRPSKNDPVEALTDLRIAASAIDHHEPTRRALSMLESVAWVAELAAETIPDSDMPNAQIGTMSRYMLPFSELELPFSDICLSVHSSSLLSADGHLRSSDISLAGANPRLFVGNISLPVENAGLISEDYQREYAHNEWRIICEWGVLGLLATFGLEWLLRSFNLWARWRAKPKRDL